MNVDYVRAWYNPKGWFVGREYVCMECPSGSEEAELNEGDTATRAPETKVELPDPPDGAKLVWPRLPMEKK